MTTADDAMNILNKQHDEFRAKYGELEEEAERLARRNRFMLAAAVGAAVGYVMTVYAVNKVNKD